MMGAILSLLTSRLAGPISAAFAVFLLALVTVQSCQLKIAEADVKKARAELTTTKGSLVTCQGNFRALDAAAKTQNAAVDRLRREGEARVAVNAKAVREARSVAESYRRQAETILAASADGDRCAAAARLIEESVR